MTNPKGTAKVQNPIIPPVKVPFNKLGAPKMRPGTKNTTPRTHGESLACIVIFALKAYITAESNIRLPVIDIDRRAPYHHNPIFAIQSHPT